MVVGAIGLRLLVVRLLVEWEWSSEFEVVLTRGQSVGEPTVQEYSASTKTVSEELAHVSKWCV